MPAPGEFDRCVACSMKTREFWTPLILSLIVTPLFLFAAVASAGAGHGSYILAKILFPFTLLSTMLFGSIIVPLLLWPFCNFRSTDSSSVEQTRLEHLVVGLLAYS